MTAEAETESQEEPVDKSNICSRCRGPLRASDGHYHEMMAERFYGPEKVCCSCRGCTEGGPRTKEEVMARQAAKRAAVAEDPDLKLVREAAEDLGKTQFSIEQVRVQLVLQGAGMDWYRLRKIMEASPQTFRKVSKVKWELA